MNENTHPTLFLVVELAAPLNRLLDSPERDSACLEIARDAARLLGTLGIPGSPEVTLEMNHEPANQQGGRLLRLRLENGTLRCPTETLLAAWHSAAQTLPEPDETRTTLIRWLEGAAPDQQVLFLRRAVLEILKRQPGALLTISAAQAYLQSLPNEDLAAEDPYRLRPVLVEPLNLLISIADREKVGDILAAGLTESSPEDLAENLIAALRPERIEIHFPPDDFHRVVRGAEEHERDLFTTLRDDLFDDLGLTLPAMRFVTSAEVPRGSMVIRINNVDSLPIPLLPPDDHIVEADMNSQKFFNGPVTPLAHPRSPFGVQHPLIRITGPGWSAFGDTVTRWRGLLYVSLWVDAFVREHAACFVDLTVVEAYLNRLASSFPAVIEPALKRVPKTALARLLRGLVAERISIGDLLAILEASLDLEMVSVPHAREKIVLNDVVAVEQPVPDQPLTASAWMVSLMRTGLKSMVWTKLTNTAQQVPILRLDEALEKRLGMAWERAGDLSRKPCMMRGGWLYHGTSEALVSAIKTHLSRPGASDSLPVLLVPFDLRTAIREILVDDLPQLEVASFNEVPPGITTVTKAVIGIS